MTTASSMINDEADYYTKDNKDQVSSNELTPIESLRARAFVPPSLPQDFLRILLDERQLAEHKDRALAHHMQFGMMALPPAPHMSHQQQFRPRHEMEAATSRGRFQINIIEAKLNKNYGFTKMDPYVRVRIANKIFETPTAYNGSKNPVWRKNIFWWGYFFSILKSTR